MARPAYRDAIATALAGWGMTAARLGFAMRVAFGR